MIFNKDDRVNTPHGKGTVAYRVMKGPTYTEAQAYSVILDRKKYDLNYTGTMFPAEKVTIPDCEDGTCGKCEICSDGYKDYVAAKMAGELD